MPQTNLPDRAVSCLNSLTHGGASQSLFIPGENVDDFYRLLEDIFAQYQPLSLHAAGIATDAVLARWFLTRRQRAFADSEAELWNLKPNQAAWTDSDLHRLDLFDRYKTQAERAFRRAFVNLAQIRKDTQRELSWQTALDLQKLRFAEQTEKFRLFQEKEARLAAERDAQERKSRELAELLKPDSSSRDTAVSQDIWISTAQNGEIKIEFFQTNAEVAEEIAQREAAGKTVDTVVRTFIVDGPVPERLAWLDDEAKPYCHEHTAEYLFRMMPEVFELVAEAEAAHPPFPLVSHIPFEEEDDDHIIRIQPG